MLLFYFREKYIFLYENNGLFKIKGGIFYEKILVFNCDGE